MWGIAIKRRGLKRREEDKANKRWRGGARKQERGEGRESERDRERKGKGKEMVIGGREGEGLALFFSVKPL